MVTQRLRVHAIFVLFTAAMLFGCDSSVTNKPETISPDDNIYFIPDSGMHGWDISIYGKGLGESGQPIKAFFGTKEATVDSVFPGRVVVSVPDVDTGFYTVHLFVGEDTIRSTKKKFHVVYIPLYRLKGIEVEINHVLATNTITYGDGQTVDSTGMHNFGMRITGTVRTNTADTLSIADTTMDDSRTIRSGLAYFHKLYFISTLNLFYHSQHLNPNINTRFWSEINLKNLPPLYPIGDSGYQVIVYGRDIAEFVTSITDDYNTYEQSSSSYFIKNQSLHDIYGYAPDATMIVTLRR